MVPIYCILIIFVASFSFTAFILNSPDKISYFNYVMLIPAPIAFTCSLFETKSLSKTLSPLTSKFHFKSLVFPIFFPILFLGLISLLTIIFGSGNINIDRLKDIGSYLPSGSSLFFAFILLLGEEYAWRAYLLSSFSIRWGAKTATLIVAFVWATWHAPLVYGLASKMGTSSSPLLFSLLQMAAVFVLSIPFAYSYFKTKNIIAPILLHFGWNWLNPFLLGNIYRNKQGVIEGNLLVINGETSAGVLLGSVVAYFLIKKIPNKGF